GFCGTGSYRVLDGNTGVLGAGRRPFGATRSDDAASALCSHCLCNAPIFDLNPCSFNPGVAKLSADYTSKTIEVLDQLGGGVVTIHPGKRTAKRPVGPLDRARLAAYLDAVSRCAFGTGFTVAIENMPPA
ncbi:MAG: sugar phosphate isomerase/epimerase, partial [Methanocorpusculum sp.]|nr:sugar phosphate isomerase/epimerase [Methanocorpusculum sp.]